MLMLIGVVVFNGGHFLVKIFYPFETIILVGNSPLCGSFSDATLIKTTVFIFWGISFMHWGALWIAKKNKQTYYKKNNGLAQALHKSVWQIDPRAIKTTGYVLVFLGLVTGIPWYISELKIAWISGYKGFLYTEIGYGSLMRILKTFLVPGAFFLLAASRNDRKVKYVSFFVILLFSGTEMITGDRSVAINVFVAYLWAWHLIIREISKKSILIVGSITLLLILPLVQIVRMMAGYRDLSIHYLYKVFMEIDNPIRLIFLTMGNSMGAIAYTVELVPRVHNFCFGETYLRGLSTILPNFFWPGGVHPGENFMSGDWFLLNVRSAAVNGTVRGVGYSVVAEAYYNYSLPGIPMIMFFWGVFVSKITLWAQKNNDLLKIAFISSFGAFILQIPRGWIASVFRPLVWYAFIPYILVFIIKNWLRKSHRVF